MIGNRIFRLAAWLLALGVLATASARADSPWSGFFTGARIEADPNKDYTLKEEQGPWIIMACSFNGAEAKKQAHDLAIELRQRFRMEAYVMEKEFKLDDPNGDIQPLYASPYRHEYHLFTELPKNKRDGTIKEIAVVVGNFSAIDDPEAQRALQRLKAADPECLKPAGSQKPAISLADWRTWQAKVVSAVRPTDSIEGRKLNGPLSRAFITPNPLLPEEYFVPKTGLDELVVKMNKNVQHSLLDCKGKYTIQVAHFSGEVILNQNDIRAIESGEKPGPELTRQGLADAAEKAHELTEALCIKHWDAYEFHDRTMSSVCVGSFDSLGAQGPDGNFKFFPQVQAIVDLFGMQTVKDADGNPRSMQLQSLVKIYFDAQPIPIEVPKRSISRQLGQRLDTAGE